MRLVHEYNREIVERWMHKQRLHKIATLEKYDRLNQLSDRRMLATEYILEGNELMWEDPAKAELYFRKALRVYKEVYKDDEKAGAEDLFCIYHRIGRALEEQGELDACAKMMRVAGDYKVLRRNVSLMEGNSSSEYIDPYDIF